MFQHPGRSRLKVVIVLAVVGIVVCVGICGIQRIRDHAATLKCRSNLRQLGMGLNNIDDARGMLPMLTDQGEGARTGQGLPSIFFSLIPWLEATPMLYVDGAAPERYHGNSSIPFTVHGKFRDEPPGTMNGGMANQPWVAFLDPADTTAHQFHDIPMTLPDGSTGYYATGSYPANGMLAWGKGSLAKMSPNGIANTIVFGDSRRYAKPHPARRSTTSGASASTARTCRHSRHWHRSNHRNRGRRGRFPRLGRCQRKRTPIRSVSASVGRMPPRNLRISTGRFNASTKTSRAILLAGGNALQWNELRDGRW